MQKVIEQAGLGGTLLEMTMPLAAISQGRARMSRNGHMYTPPRTREYKKEVAKHAAAAMSAAGVQPFDCFCDVRITARYKVPKSWPAAKKALALAGVLRPVKGDWDNVAKAICDAMNGLVYIDDKYVSSGAVDLVYGTEDEVEVSLTKTGLTNYEIQAATSEFAAVNGRRSNRPTSGSAPLGKPRRSGVSVRTKQSAANRKRAPRRDN